VAFIVNTPLNAPESGPDAEPVPWSAGIPVGLSHDVIILPWNDLEAVQKVLEQRGAEIAAVITEPMMCNNGCIPPEPGFLEGIRVACDLAGCALIFDEIITGFRVSLGGAQQHFGVTPDLAIFGKAMGSGFPISALVGKQKLMDVLVSGKAIQAGTMNSQNASVAAALATVTELEKKSPQLYSEFHRLAGRLRSALQSAAQEFGHPILTQGVGPAFHVGFTSLPKVKNYRDVLQYDTKKYQVFVAGMRQRGIRLIPRGLWYLSAVHTSSDIEIAAEAARATLSEMKSGE
jgi:glutamate-1-semialdehyde 2,1-aminomutase